jgi:tRNA G10  N-methylase Trm11
MYKYLASFIKGTKEIVLQNLVTDFQEVNIVFDNEEYIVFEINEIFNNAESIPYIDQLYYLLSFHRLGDKNLEKMLVNVLNSPEFAEKLQAFDLNINSTYRVVESAKNHDKKKYRELVREIEDELEWHRIVQIDRGHPLNEIRIIEKDDFGFAGVRLSAPPEYKGDFDRNSINPSLAYLLLSLAELKPEDKLWDPFCGGGIIPLVAAKYFTVNKVIASDIDVHLIKEKMRLFKTGSIKIVLAEGDFHAISDEIEAVDAIVTDPPWGISQIISDLTGFYTDIIKISAKKLKKDGSLILLTSTDLALKEIVQNQDKFKLESQYNVVVSGKSAVIWKLKLL